MASPVANNVFLSFSGEDTRHSFMDHLYNALKSAGISTFRDNEEIKRGEKLEPEIQRMIKESRASVIVLSQNYATSTWCLDELALILQQRRECNQFVLPVFYHVDPSDVRKQSNTFAIEVKASSRWTDDNVNLWKKALKEVADLAGMVLCGSETKFLKEIVDTIRNKLDCKEVYLPLNITGMATRYKEISSWLNQSNAEVLAIYGMGGSGKTTLAKYIYNYSSWKTYENMTFVEGISRICAGTDDLRPLQEQLLHGILGGKKRKILSVSEGTCKIEEALQTKRSLIVLDDIAEDSQFVALLGTGKSNAQSKIIITTRRENTDDWFKSTNWRCQKYKMELLNADESLELLSRHAFGSKDLMEGFKELAEQAVQYCDGNPLALEVLGSALSQKNTILHWKSQLETLEKDIHSRIQNVLIMSYNSLSLVLEKELFLHIACFFVGKDKDYVVNILRHDYKAESGIISLSNRCLLSVSPDKKLMMHPLLQEMGKNIVRQESKFPEERSRVWHGSDSYKILNKGDGSKTMEGLALDMQLLDKQIFALKSSNLKTDALQKMDRLKLLQLNFVQLTGSYENFSEELRWLCWLGSNLRTIPSGLFMGNLVAIDMSYSKLEVFEPPMVLQSLQILNLTHSHDLSDIRNMSMIPNLETLILWNCHSLARVCETIGDLTSLALLNMTGCKKVCNSEQTEASTFSFPRSLDRLFLNNCHLDCTDFLPLDFCDQPSLQYLNLSNSLFDSLPCYDHLKNLRVLDLSLCSILKKLVCLPSTLAELYVDYCESLEEISFQSHRFTLQEFGYEGCISLSEIENFIKLVPVAKLEENDLGHMKWLKAYENHDVFLVGDDKLTKGRSSCAQILYEFIIMSTSLPDMEDPNMKPTYVSELSSLSFDVPSPPKNRRLKGIDVTFKYTISGDDDWVWFCKITTSNGVNLMYNPLVFGKPESGEVGIWLSYWPIGNRLDTGDKVNVSIAVISGLEVRECGVSLVYTDDKAKKTLENNMGWVESLGGDLSGFQLSTGAYYLCRRDFFELMEVGRLAPGWFSILVGDTIVCTEVRGWTNTGQPMQLKPSFTELKFIRCIMHGPESEEIYKITEMSKSSFVDKPLEFTSSLLGDTMESSTSSKFSETTTKREASVPSPLVDYSSFAAADVDRRKRIKVEAKKVRGTLVLQQNHSLSTIKDELFGRKVSLQLISAAHCESTAGGLRGKLGKETDLKNWSSAVIATSTKGDSTFELDFDWEEEIGVPGAFLITNRHQKEFYLKTLTLEQVPNCGRVHFICNSWVYPQEHYNKQYHIFFSNWTHLPGETPIGLRHFREEELEELRGNGTGKREEWDRIYDYDVYNDLSEPDKGSELVRPTFGGTPDYPYPRRCRTGRLPSKTDPKTETRIPILQSLKIYVPRDERFSDLKMGDVHSYGIKLVSQGLLPGFEAVVDKLSDVGALEIILKHTSETISSNESNEFSSFEDVLKLYKGGLTIPKSDFLINIRENIPFEFFIELFRSDGERLSRFPVPQVIQGDESAWMTDEEFGREMLAGINPVVIRRLQEFPPCSKLDPIKFGNQNSTITEDHIKDQLDGLSVLEAISCNKLFILDHHDPLMPYLRGINETPTKTYATRTFLFLQKDETLKPLAIELSLPHPNGDEYGVISTIHTPALEGAKGTIWLLAKAYANVNDSGYHQLVCHWLHTHASIEPFIIATNRQLSVLHPIHKLLHPHFRDTMNIDALSRQMLISAGGLLEKTAFPDKYSMELSCNMYKEWNFTEQALPADLIKRGLAVEDPTSRHGIRLLIQDYPYAVDGLEVWSAIKSWVTNYITIYYKNNNDIQCDTELQQWWTEVRTKGHGDKQHEPWWPTMQTCDDLIQSCTTIIWIASALHAAVNFGQYPYGGYLPNRPAMIRRFIPEPGTIDYNELETDPVKAFLKTVTPQLQSVLGISLMEILSRHSADEVFLGQREREWTDDDMALGKFKKFGEDLRKIERRIVEMNLDESLKNRYGPAKMPYTLLFPSSEIGLTGRGIPNSVSI